MLTLNYDKHHDVLYLGVADNNNSYGSDFDNNINIFRDIDTDCITGFIIFGFMSKFVTHTLPPITEPFPIDYRNDVLPHIN
ncbi:MAG: hypothetical protein FWC73_08260 [Defluviitaleaceae bacterium]|nr:hypothetical protein [Defluviitaleaceae bacterium]